MVSSKYKLKTKEIYKRHTTSKKDKKTYLFYVGVEYLCGSVLRQKASTRTCFPFSGFQVQFACPPVFQNLGRGFNSNLIQARSEKISKMVLISCHLSILLACLSVSLSVWRLVDSLLVTVIVGLPPINL